MMKITAHRRVRLARMVLVLGEGREGTKVTSWDCLARSRPTQLQIQIPVKLIEQMLARKRQEPAKTEPKPNVQPRPKTAGESPRFVLPLARVVIPL